MTVRLYWPNTHYDFTKKLHKFKKNKKFVKRWQFFCSAWLQRLQFHEKNYENSKQTKKSWKYDGSSALLDCDFTKKSLRKFNIKKIVKTWRVFCSAWLQFHENSKEIKIRENTILKNTKIQNTQNFSRTIPGLRLEQNFWWQIICHFWVWRKIPRPRSSDI